VDTVADIVNLDQLVLSDDDADLRLAVHLFLTDELGDAAAEQMLTRLADPRIAQLLADAVRLETIAFEATESDSPDLASPKVELPQRAVRPGSRVVAYVVMTLTVMVAFWAWPESHENEPASNDDSHLVAEMWARQLSPPDVQAAMENFEQTAANLTDFSGRAAVGLEPPMWLLAATSYSAEQVDEQEHSSEEGIR
jgi:hypothetical protein